MEKIISYVLENCQGDMSYLQEIINKLQEHTKDYTSNLEKAFIDEINYQLDTLNTDLDIKEELTKEQLSNLTDIMLNSQRIEEAIYREIIDYFDDIGIWNEEDTSNLETNKKLSREDICGVSKSSLLEQLYNGN